LALIVTPAIEKSELTATSSDVSSPPVITERLAAIAEHHVEAVRGAPEPRDDHAGAAASVNVDVAAVKLNVRSVVLERDASRS